MWPWCMAARGADRVNNSYRRCTLISRLVRRFSQEVAMAGDRWVTFDCYGTLADWNACMQSALEPVAGPSSGPLVSAYHQAELILEAGPEWQPYREILTTGLRMAAERTGVRLRGSAESAFVKAWPEMPVFADAGPALSALVAAG